MSKPEIIVTKMTKARATSVGPEVVCVCVFACARGSMGAWVHGFVHGFVRACMLAGV